MKIPFYGFNKEIATDLVMYAIIAFGIYHVVGVVGWGVLY